MRRARQLPVSRSADARDRARSERGAPAAAGGTARRAAERAAAGRLSAGKARGGRGARARDRRRARASIAHLLWFNLGAARRRRGRGFAQAEFRQALSCAVDREAFVRTVYLGAATPSWGIVSPANRTWFSEAADRPPYDLDARALAAGRHSGSPIAATPAQLEDASGTPVRFTHAGAEGHRRAARRALRSCARRSPASACAWTSSRSTQPR